MDERRPMNSQGEEARGAGEGRADPHEPKSAGRRGVDRTLIDWMLSLTPAERLEVAQDWVAMVDCFGGADRAD